VKPPLDPVGSRFGAPMGRRNEFPETGLSGPLRLARLRLVDGGYDEGGAYWGSGRAPMWLAWEGRPEDARCRIHVRAANRAAARAKVREHLFRNHGVDASFVAD